MLAAGSIKFLKDLKKNNDKAWFDQNRKAYEAARADFIQLTQGLINAVGKWDPAIGILEPKQCIFRINRDVRFSKNKSPYKTNMGASINAGGKKINNAGYYFHFEPGNSFVGGGFYMPEAADLAKIRQEIDYSFDSDFKKIISHKKFKTVFPNGVEAVAALSRPPKGYDAEHPAIDFLKMKGFIVTRPISDAELQNKQLISELNNSFAVMKDFIDFLNRALD
ncbi:MAG: DUF2461 domain-containing protein [Chitinophagaceae bacterium]